jgi:prepilin-type N-terminal cleavage/methylation domain-containing protein
MKPHRKLVIRRRPTPSRIGAPPNGTARIAVGRRGVTLVEVMLSIAVLGIVAAMAVPSFEPEVATQLDAFAQITASDLMAARDLAVANNSTYRLTFELSENRYRLEHVGTNPALNTLPTTIFPNRADTSTKHYTDLDDLPRMGIAAYLAAVELGSSPATSTTILEFGPLGATSQSIGTTVWLSAGAGASQCYLAVRIDPTTGIATVDAITSTAPTTAGS